MLLSLLQHYLSGQGLTSASILQEDPWNSIAAGALTGGFLQLRMGAKSAARSAAFGGVLLVSMQPGIAAQNRLASAGLSRLLWQACVEALE